MYNRHRLALVGCGGMGRRHLYGYRVLNDYEPGRVDVAAVIDLELERAEFVANEAEKLFGTRPKAYRSLEEALAGTPDLSMLDIVTVPSVHLSLIEIAAEAKLSALCEKPMAPTVADCLAMRDTVQRNGTVLSIAENNRRDPVSRLASALINAGAIGDVRTVIDFTSGGGRMGFAGGWQYRRSEGGAILESGVHNADMQLYLVGPVKQVMGQIRLHERERVYKGAPIKQFHEHYADVFPDVQAADAPDTALALFEFESGALGQWLYDLTAYGPGFRKFTIYGSRGQIELPTIRTGKPLQLYVDGHDDPLDEEEALALVPDFALDDRTARFFGGERLWRYNETNAYAALVSGIETPSVDRNWMGSGVGNDADFKMAAIQVAEVLDALDNGSPVEIGPDEGLAAAALVLAIHESSEAGRPVSMTEIADGSLSKYQTGVS